ncbi:MAG: TrbG/VirB9 family P-type conjugative transfer protein [Allosphingosinicella sp.]
MLLLLILGCSALAAAPLEAQVRPRPGTEDPRIQSVDFVPDQVVVLSGATGYQLTLELSPDEQVETVAVGDASAWQVVANHRGDHLFIKAAVDGVSTNMTVITTVRTYNFELVPANSGEMAYTVRFRYPPPDAPDTEELANAAVEGRYHIDGDKALRPSEMSDDGVHTYIRWPRDRSLPAVYGLTDTGREVLINGMMRNDDLFVIDSVSRKLVFRIDDRVATATRQSRRP